MTLDSRYRVEELLGEKSTTTESKYFRVFPGEIAYIQAFGFNDFKALESEDETRVIESACMEMVLFKEEPLPAPANNCGCASGVVDITTHKGEILAREQLRSGGCTVSLDLCNNILLWNVPGVYRLVLNDPTAPGRVRIYMQIFSKDEFPWNYAPIYIGG